MQIITPLNCDPPKEGQLEGSTYRLSLQCEEFMSPTLEMSSPDPWAYESNPVLT